MIVSRYIAALNYDSLPSSQMLYIESKIFDFNDRSDSLVMKRWFMSPHYFRTELWHNQKLLVGYSTDGMNYAYQFDTLKQSWKTIDLATYYDHGSAYDFHGPLYYWRTNGTELQYVGEKEVGGVDVYQVHAETPNMFARDYLFEKENGLLFFIIEHPQTYSDQRMRNDTRVEWRAYSDYIKLGKSMLPYTESYKKDGLITVINHRYAFLKRDKRKFEKN